jgi:hypothetical protein
MGNKKISELNLLTTPQLSTVIPVVEGGETQKLPVGTLLQSGLPVSASSITATSIHVEGNITADSFTIVSSSIIYATGSTNFGDSSDDTHTFTGSIFLSGSSSFAGNHILSGTSTLIGNTVVSGSIEVSGSSNFHNSIFILTGSTYFSGAMELTGSLSVFGNLNVVSGSNFYRWGNKLFNYGAFSDSRIQSASANTEASMLFNTLDISESGIELTSGSRILFHNTGVYNIQFSAQLQRIAGSGTVVTSVWLAYTGSNVEYSGGDVTLTGNAGSAQTITSWNYVLPITAGDWVELKWSTPDPNIVLFATGSRTAPIRPSVPSIILTATQVA